MKVLFAVNDEKVSEEIIKKYQKDYKEIISYKNVYYFNAIIKEMQRDKSYDRIVIGEDLEPFANNNYDTIDKFLFEKLDNISDEATDNGEKDAQIILICSDRRTKSDKLLVKLFGIGVYSAIIGKDRSVEEVCRLINNPRTKKEAKQYYQIDSEDVDYKTENDTDVNENEIQSILKHYRSLGRNEDKYVESFDNIAAQYTDAQLRIIIKFLPINVKAVLEEKSQKYQQLVMFGDNQYKRNNTSNIISPDTKYRAKSKNVNNAGTGVDLSIDAIENRVSNPLTGKPIIIPAAIRQEKTAEIEKKLQELSIPGATTDNKPDINVVPVDEPAKKRRGRPKKIIEQTEDTVLPGIEEEKDEQPYILPGIEEEEVTLPGLEQEPEPVPVPETTREVAQNYEEHVNMQQNHYEGNNQIERRSSFNSYNELSNLLTGDKKIVAFVGSPKNGTSFVVNNLAELLSSMGINTAILDLTENKNSYYIYTKNEEELRKTAYASIKKLKENVADGIRVNKNFSVYTELPGEGNEKTNIQSILSTLVNNHNLILLDCDFNTNPEYFESAQEIYLVQSMDILTIQPLTAFLRDLKNDGVLRQEKLRIIINKHTKIRGLNEKVLVGGMAFYNSPSMSFMTELFSKESVKICTIPLDENTYVAYLEAMVSCEISLNQYSKAFIQSLKELAGIVYPLLNKQTYSPMKKKNAKAEDDSRGYFSANMNNTLEQMNRMKNRN